MINVENEEYNNLNTKQEEKTMEDDTSLSSWDNFTGNYLKPEDVRSNEDAYVVINVTSEEFDNKSKVILSLERKEIKKDFVLNATNVKAVRDLDVENPKALVGQKIYFIKIKVTNPSTKKLVDSLVIDKAEKV